MSKMPIAAAMLAGVPVVRLGDMLEAANPAGGRLIGDINKGRAAMSYHVSTADVAEIDDRTKGYLLNAIGHSTPFNIQVASDLYWCGKKAFYRLDQDFGRMRPPYNEIWFEWQMPRQFIDNDGQATTLAEHQPPEVTADAYYAASIRYFDVDEITNVEPATVVRAGTRGGVVVSILSASKHRGSDDINVVMLNECALAFALDDDGFYVNDSLRAGQTKDPGQPEAIRQLLHKEVMSNTFVACMALNLINCRNVTTRPAGTIPQRRSGSDKRRGLKQPIKYQTILLPGMTVERSHTSSRDRQRNLDVMAMHVVRGHFKTYTKDAPLMGRHVGTYWWNPTVKGNQKNGQIVSDYKIAGA